MPETKSERRYGECGESGVDGVGAVGAVDGVGARGVSGSGAIYVGWWKIIYSSGGMVTKERFT